MKYPPYPDYQPIQNSVFERLPVHWQMKRLKFIAEVCNGRDQKEVLDDNGPYLVYGSGGPFGCATAYLHDGVSVLLGRKGTIDKPLLVTEPFWTVDTMFYTRIAEGVDPRYFYYLCTTIPFDLHRDQTTLPSMTQSGLADIVFSVAPHVEQAKIADFLDWRTAQIDVLIAKKQALIERLQEYREAVIRHAVSGGLDDKSVFKDSGVKWLGAIPEHWSVSKIKFIAEIASGHTPSRSVDEYWQDCTIPWVSLNDSKTLRERDFISETHYRISELGLANSSARLLPAGVVVFSRDATVGLCAITEVPMAVSQHFIAYICGEKLLAEFLLLVLKAMQQHLQSLQTGSTIVTIGMPEIRGLETPLPPLEDQRAIVKHIDDECASLDESLRLARDAIEKLTEYRSALITAAVTGQIDVRGVKVPAPV